MNGECILSQALNFGNEITDARRYLHMHPGTGFDIGESVEFVRCQLEKMGYEPMRCGRAGIVALAGGKRPGRTFLLRADMDALPISEEADVDFRSENGRMHACGHDMHTAMLLGAARILKEHEDEICGTVKLMFQPAEEIFQGAGDMLDAGVLENPKVDAAMMIHVMAGMPMAPGTVIVSAPGVSAPAADYFEITVQGVGCHGSMPNMGVDPLNAAAHILIALQEINARELGLADKAVVTIGTMHSGNAANAIPDKAVMGGSIRTYDEDVRAIIKRRLTEISTGVASAFRARAEVTFGSGCPTLKNDPALSKAIGGYMKELLGNERALNAADMAGDGASKSAGSEDFAYVSQRVPSVMLALAAGQPEKGHSYPQHHPKVTFDEAALPAGSAVYAYAAMRWLEENK